MSQQTYRWNMPIPSKRGWLLNILLSVWMPFLIVAPAQADPSIDALATFARTPTNPFSLETASQFEARYREVWQLLDENTLYPERLTSWEEWEHKYDGKLNSPEGSEQAISDLVGSLGDEYTYLRNSDATKQREVEYEQRQVVSYRMLADNLAYIHIKTFASRHVAEELEQTLRTLAPAEGYILDLRGNKGGCVDEAYKSCAMFIDKGEFASMRGRMHGIPYNERLLITAAKLKSDTNGVVLNQKRVFNLTGRKPLLVIVNNTTKSAAEMLAGALRDNHRAKLVGSRTFGKGIVQNSWLLDDGTSVKIAIARYYLPSGRCINGVGIDPDIYVTSESKGKQKSRDVLLQQSILLLKRNLAKSPRHRIELSHSQSI